MVVSVSRTNAVVCTEEVTVDMEEDMGKSRLPVSLSS
jgi:hypothetical protein